MWPQWAAKLVRISFALVVRGLYHQLGQRGNKREVLPMGEQLTNAGIIINVGQSLGANSKQLLAAIEAALVESGLRNLNYGDRDSLGLFQQRPSQGWGSQSQVMDPYHAAQSFFAGAGTNHGALQVSQSGTAGQLAQRVQRSAYPSKYDQREADAIGILANLGAGSVQGGNGSGYDNFFGIPLDAGLSDESGDWHLPEYQPVADDSSGSSTLVWIAAALVGVLVIVSLVDE